MSENCQNSSDIVNNIELGKLYKNSGELKKAESIFRKILKSFPDNEEAHFELGNIYNAEKENESAAKEYKKTLRINSFNEAALIELSKVDITNN